MRKDVELYLASMAKDVKRMNEIVEKANKQISDGLLTEEQCSTLFKQMEVLNSNYQRIVYIEYLLNKKPAIIQKFIDRKNKKKILEFAKNHADKQSVEAENKAALDKMDSIVKVTEVEEVKYE